jgi:hypothetical protein
MDHDVDLATYEFGEASRLVQVFHWEAETVLTAGDNCILELAYHNCILELAYHNCILALAYHNCIRSSG